MLEETRSAISGVIAWIESILPHQAASQAAAAAVAAPTPAAIPPTAATTATAPVPTPKVTLASPSKPIITIVPQQDAVSKSQLSGILSSLAHLVSSLPTATPTTNVVYVPTSSGYSSNATPPIGGGSSNTIAAANSIDQLNGVTITNANLTASEIPTLSYLPLAGGTLSGALNVPTINASSSLFSNLTITSATSTNLFASIANFTSAIASTFNASIANIVGLTATNATTTNLAVTGTGYFGGNVGIGTTSPPRLLTLDSSSATGTIFRMSNSSPGGHVYDFLETGSANTGGAGRLDFFDSTAGLARLSIASNGNVGVGTTSPFTNFAVNGNAFLAGNLNVGDASTTRYNLGLVFSSNSNAFDPGYDIAAWGDSLTRGDYITQSYPSQLSVLTGRPVFNGGVSGDTSTGIASRMLADIGKRNYTVVIWSGRNDFVGNAAGVEANIASMIAGLGSNQHYLVLSILNSSAEPSGSSNYNQIIAINQYLATTYPGHYLDIRSYLITNGLSAAGITPSAQDLIDISNDIPPTDLRYDTVHLNNSGYGVVAQQVANFIQTNLDVTVSTSSLIAVGNIPSIFANPLMFGGPINTTGASGGFQMDGNFVLYASTTNVSLAVGASSAASWLSATSTSLNDIAIGTGALGAAATSNLATYNLAIGTLALSANTTGYNNTALAAGALGYNTSGSANVAEGVNALQLNTTGSNNVAVGINSAAHGTTSSYNSSFGATALNNNLTGRLNVAVGYASLANNASATSSVAIGYQTAQGPSTYHNQGGTAVGFQAGYNFTSGSDYNTLIGYQSGYGITTGTRNVFLGQSTISASQNQVTMGSNNISIGNNVAIASSTLSNQLDIGNLIYGTGLTGTGTSVSPGLLGIGTTTPYSTLSVWGPNTGSTSAFAIVNSASTTEFTVLDNGNATLAGTLTQNSDQRLKTNIQGLDASSSLAAINDLNPVTFNWIDPNKSSVPQYGFIAQQVESIFPSLVSTTSPTALTPDGTLSLNYIDLISPIVKAIQALSSEIASLTSTVSGFANSFATQHFSAHDVTTQQLCVGSTCINQQQLAALLASQNQSPPSQSIPSTATTTPPVISINGANPAIIQAGATYNDLGATITGPVGDTDLDITTYVNGVATNPVALDTSSVATDTIDYVVTDQNGLTSTSTRTVIIQAPAAVNATGATSTAQ